PGRTVADVDVPAVAEGHPLRIPGQLGQRRRLPRVESAFRDPVQQLQRLDQAGRAVPPVAVALVAAAVGRQRFEIAGEAVDGQVDRVRAGGGVVGQEQRGGEEVAVYPRVPV